ncbi:hypothetical protein DM860_010446 [Cuscuta australis]|uniref:Retrotransposon Copia-like N-terminal domain-containing protein n=1 Tax=Cuscuta australis TaxID=267555 RepID=A0A328E4W1_9ASTE|nr:hypothetical protein DM860_010446 [Cuscuta australis]
MTTETTKKTWLIHDPSTIYYLHPSEHAGNALTKYLLKSDNYEVWEKGIRNALGGRGKAIFLIPNGVPKPKDERELAAWESNNSIICSWIFNSVDESIQPSIVSHSVASVLWSDLKKRYSTSNGPRIYQLKTELNALRQKGQTVVAYYNQFITLWNQLHETGDPTGGCTCTAAATTRAKFEREKTIDFLLGLDDEQFGPLRSNLLGTEPIPDLDRVFHLVSQEERHRTIIRSRDDKTDAMAFATRRDDRITRPPPPSEKLLCTHCGRTNHNVDACYELVGFPAHYTRLSANRGPSAGRGGRGGSAGGRATTTGGRGGGRRGTPAVGNNTSVAYAATDETSNPNLSDQMARLIFRRDNVRNNGSRRPDGPAVLRRRRREDPVPDLREGPDNDAVIVGRIELQETVEELFKVVFGVDVLLENHLEHGVPEVEVRVVGVFLDGDALPADPPEAVHRPEALDLGVGFRGGVVVVVGRGECGGGGVPRAGGVIGVVHRRRRCGRGGGFVVVVAAAGLGEEDGGEFGPSAAAAAANLDSEAAQNNLFLVRRHCRRCSVYRGNGRGRKCGYMEMGKGMMKAKGREVI